MSLSNDKFCEFLLPLVEKADQIPRDRHPELLRLLQEGFVGAFKETESSKGLGSREEVKLSITRAVKEFHDKAPRTNPDFFTNPAYHPQAALFLQEFLRSLTGNSKEWFRELQVACMSACRSILQCIGWRNVRLCVPGVVSGTIRYIMRSHLGKDSVVVRHGALAVLTEALVTALSTTEDPEWILDAVSHLSSAMRNFLSPKALVETAYDCSSLLRIRRLIGDVLGSEAFSTGTLSNSLLIHQLLVAYMVVENMIHVSTAEVPAEAKPEDLVNADKVRGDVPFVTDTYLRSEVAVQVFKETVEELRGVELLHFVTSLTRFPTTRGILISKGEDSIRLFLSFVKKCVRVVGTLMSPEDLYTDRAPRCFPAGVVDECLECVAHALAALPGDEASCYFPTKVLAEDDETPGEVLTNALLDSCEAALEEWDLYAIHPPTIYVLTRLVTWQFKPLSEAVRPAFAGAVLPLGSDFTASGAFEQLWSVVARPHLWDITLDEELCSYQQIHHRQVVAATILRFLSVATREVLAPALRQEREASGSARSEAQRAFTRFVTLTLYLIMEKATATGIVREAATMAVQSLFSASGCESALSFFLDSGVHLIDDASRAVKETHLRPAAASVLRGAVEFAIGTLAAATRKEQEDVHEPSEEATASTQKPPFVASAGAAARLHGPTQLPLLVRHRLSIIEIMALHQDFGHVTEIDVVHLADFATATVQVACDCCRVAAEERDAYGTRAALSLLRDAFDIAAVLNYCSPLEADDDERERQTTSFNERVQLLQEEVRDAVLLVLSHCFADDLDGVAPTAVQVVVRGLLSFLTTKTAEGWAEEQVMKWNESQLEKRRARREAKERKREKQGAATPIFPLDDEANDEGQSDTETPMPKLVSPPLPWISTNADGEASDTVVLQRSHLKTVYRAYLCFVSLLKEPIARFLTKGSRPGRRKGEERRQLEAIPVTPSFFAALSGLEALTILTPDFLENRMGQDILPVALVWYEKAALPRIPTNTDERVKQAVRQFAASIVGISSTVHLRNAVRDLCKPWFHLSDMEEEEGDGESASAMPVDEVSSDQTQVEPVVVEVGTPATPARCQEPQQ